MNNQYWIVYYALRNKYPIRVRHSSQVSIFSLSAFQVSLTIPLVTLLRPYSLATGYLLLSYSRLSSNMLEAFSSVENWPIGRMVSGAAMLRSTYPIF